VTKNKQQTCHRVVPTGALGFVCDLHPSLQV